MSTSKRIKHRNKVVVAGLATVAALAGGAGVAAAGGPTQTEGTQQQSNDVQEPSLNGSVPASEVAGETEQQEASRLAADAKVSQSQAEAAALTSAPGTVTASELGNENSSLIWEVDVRKADGSTVEVKVDAGDGKVLAQEADDEGGAKSTSPSQDGEQDEAGETTTG